MAVFIAFLLLGAVIGTLAAFTATSVVASLLPLFFAFSGGTAIAFAGHVDASVLKRACIAISGLSLGCLVGLYSGVLVSQHKWLTPQQERAAATAAGTSYLRNYSLSEADMIDQQLRAGTLTPEQAYSKLQEIHRGCSK